MGKLIFSGGLLKIRLKAFEANEGFRIDRRFWLIATLITKKE